MLNLGFDFRYTELVYTVLDESKTVSLFGRFEYLLVILGDVSVANVLTDWLVEEKWLLHDNSDLLSDVFD